MKSTGIIRSTDNLGRIVLPKELRTSFSITTETPLEIFTDGDAIILRKYRPAGSCDFCGEVTADTVEYRGMHICGACRRAIGQL
ncbi:MAG TPA: AbrB/MazE/SpoVT family DNA-binding domain-containing protein [Candidatus Gemmiger faecigallinarum]|nr:AbrB/MazE/SpoVT family DNA-binding domain-containing protein [Candidatus Gemmiger faecigallinarum]